MMDALTLADAEMSLSDYGDWLIGGNESAMNVFFSFFKFKDLVEMFFVINRY